MLLTNNMPGAQAFVLFNLHALAGMMSSKHHYPHFTDEKIKTQGPCLNHLAVNERLNQDSNLTLPNASPVGLSTLTGF